MTNQVWGQGECPLEDILLLIKRKRMADLLRILNLNMMLNHGQIQ